MPIPKFEDKKYFVNDFQKERLRELLPEVQKMLDNPLSVEEMLKQVKQRPRRVSGVNQIATVENQLDTEEAHRIQATIKQLEPPLGFEMASYIVSALFYKQLTLEMIPPDIFEELKETKQYKYHLKRIGEDK